MTIGRPDPSSEALRDPRFDAAWRAASREEPPAALDAAILAAARRAVGAGPQPLAVPEATRPERWWWPLAAAASIGAVAIGILQITESDRAGTADPVRAIVSDMPAERPSARQSAPHSAAPAAPPLVPAPASPASMPAPVAPSLAPAPSFVPAPAVKAEPALASPPPARGDAAAREESAPSRKEARAVGGAASAAAPGPPSAPPAAPAAAPAPTPVAPPAGPNGATSARDAQPFPADAAAPGRANSESARPAALGKVMTAPGAGARADERARAAASLPLADWLALIRKLRAEGRTDELNREIAAFRAAHPDAEQQLVDTLAAGSPTPPAPAR